MTPDSADYSRPEGSAPKGTSPERRAASPKAVPHKLDADQLSATLGRVGRLEVRARQTVEGLLGGLHRSPYFGRSLEFREHRQYAHGDDPRHVDWKVWARRDRLFVKQYEEDTNLRGTLLVDCSPSMSYGAETLVGGAAKDAAEGGRSKHEHAAIAACALAHLMLKQNDSVACVGFGDDLTRRAPHRSHHGHLMTIAGALAPEPEASSSASSPQPEGDAAARAMRAVAAEIPRRGVVVILSDLLGDLQAFAESLALLRSRGHDLVVLHVLHDDELDFPFDEPAEFVGLEGGDQVRANPRALRAGYLKAMDSFLQRAAQACRRQRADYLLMRTSEPIDAALGALLAGRDARSRRALPTTSRPGA
ncbi:hypothetical protein Mal64_03400 [Pseudobythopirellula maris]|uniref:DUF58 domain-containing protein n=1 Tax=Pseudobythopirellula maris TaxID=2527991 RepID=A0A5C5ZSB0_9BACT|nr:DUF58 domain-containing protein [Pseudobythopirellula maris]TWT89958.1 hypothetical protein Mal64_03400 [Pseudobythopirellula maris]